MRFQKQRQQLDDAKKQLMDRRKDLQETQHQLKRMQTIHNEFVGIFNLIFFFFEFKAVVEIKYYFFIHKSTVFRHFTSKLLYF